MVKCQARAIEVTSPRRSDIARIRARRSIAGVYGWGGGWMRERERPSGGGGPLGVLREGGRAVAPLDLRGLLVELVGKLELLAGLPGVAVEGVAGQEGEQRRQLAEDHLFVDNVHLAPGAGFAEG